MPSLYYDKQGKPITMDEWGKFFNDMEYKVIKQTTLSNGKWVSTVWLGLGYSFEPGAPLIFETMVFPKEGDYSEEGLDRYSTLEEAQQGHEKMCKEFDN